MNRKLCLVPLLVVITLTWINCGSRPLESDENLIAKFHNHRQAFERVAVMMKEDTEVRSIYSGDGLVMFRDYRSIFIKDGRRYDDAGDPVFSVERWNEYNWLFDNASDLSLHRISREEDGIHVASGSIASRDIDALESIIISKDFVYSETEPSPLVESLNNFGFESPDSYYRRISANWYLRFDKGISKPE